MSPVAQAEVRVNIMMKQPIRHGQELIASDMLRQTESLKKLLCVFDVLKPWSGGSILAVNLEQYEL